MTGVRSRRTPDGVGRPTRSWTRTAPCRPTARNTSREITVAQAAPTGPLVLSEGGETAWERGWGVYSHVGYLARVVLRVTATEPPIVFPGAAISSIASVPPAGCSAAVPAALTPM